MKICLATRHVTPEFTPLALLGLKAHLVHTGNTPESDVVLAEFKPEDGSEAIAESLLGIAPDVLGLSCYVWNITALLDAARRIKEARPGVKIVLGGPEVGPVAEEVLTKSPWIDAIVRVEGEIPFRDLVIAWRSGAPISAVLGVTHREGERVVSNADAPIVRDLNELTSPHTLGYLDLKGRFICLETQRGCVFRCNFCFYNKDYSIRNRRFAMERTKAELLYWLGQDVAEIYLMDPVFNLNAERAKEICRFIALHNTRRIPFHTEVWAEFIDDEMASLFAQASMKFIEVGLQTTDAAVLNMVDRRLKLQPFIDGIGHLKKHGLHFELQLIAGLPGETVRSFRASLDFAARLEPPTLSVFDLLILPGTELARKAKELGISFDPTPPYQVRSHGTMPASDLALVSNMAQTAGALWPSHTLRLLARAEKRCTFSGMVDEWNAWHGGPPEKAAVRERLDAFVRHYCERNELDPGFFLAFARVEQQAIEEARAGSAGG
jgi:anaerobic magnesium-protoporphyrin IX monomethyl ester cyclase